MLSFVYFNNYCQVGDSVPSIDLFENTPANKINLSELCDGKTVILFAVPGAFTPGCSKVNSRFLIEIICKFYNIIYCVLFRHICRVM